MENVVAPAIALTLYLGLTVLIGWYGYRFSKSTPDDYFLAGRGLGPLLLFFTLIATNFSAFFFLGFAGRSYHVGYSFYGIMSFGTALVAISIYLVGYKAWQAARQHSIISPPELIGVLLGSKALKMVYLAVMVVFTIPYLAIQPIGAGYLLERLTDGAISYYWGAGLLSIIIVFYVFFGGMRSVAWTDVLQGVLMMTLMIVAVIIVADKLGGIGEANRQALELDRSLFSREGRGEVYQLRSWISFSLLWPLAVPMFPQILMRFFTAKSARALKTSAVLYPFVTAFLFLGPVMIGVWGNLVFPGLSGNAADQILPMMLQEFAPLWIGSLVTVGALAAFMSTMDSQLLALSTMLTRDVYQSVLRPAATLQRQVFVGRILIVLLAATGLVIALQPHDTIAGIVQNTFSGLAVLFPTTVAALYWRRTSAKACLLSILCGEALLAGFVSGVIPPGWTMGFEPVIPVVLAAAGIIIVGSLAGKQSQGRPGS